jgi:hypothetical protein
MSEGGRAIHGMRRQEHVVDSMFFSQKHTKLMIKCFAAVIYKHNLLYSNILYNPSIII